MEEEKEKGGFRMIKRRKGEGGCIDCRVEKSEGG